MSKIKIILIFFILLFFNSCGKEVKKTKLIKETSQTEEVISAYKNGMNFIETGDYCLNKQIAEAMKRIYSDALANNLSIYSSVENIASSYNAIDRYSPKIIAEALNLRKENNCHNFLNVGWLDTYESNSGIVANH